MKRDASLVPLSRQHFHALVLCMRIHRKRAERSVLQREMLELWSDDVRFHFQAEEKFLFPAARRIAPLAPLVRELRAEHTRAPSRWPVVERSPARNSTASPTCWKPTSARKSASSLRSARSGCRRKS